MLAEKVAAPDSEKRKSLKLAAATTLTTNGIPVTTGYLLKLSVVPAKAKDKSTTETSWKKRFFMLRGSTLSYYSDHLSMDAPKGELLVFGQTKFATDENGAQKNSFSLEFPFNELKLSCESGLDFFVWSKAFKAAIALAQQALVGYIDKSSDAEDGSKRKYFILHQDALTYHKDESSIGSVQGIMHLNDHTIMEYFDKKHQIAVIDTVEKHSLMLTFKEHTLDNKDGNYAAWKDAFIANLQLYAASIQDAETSFNTKIGLPGMIKKGNLYMKPLKGVDDTWPEYQFYLNESQMVAVDSSIVAGQEHTKMMGDFEITPNCSVFETNLGPHTFELVTASKVLHVRATTSYEVSAWIDAIKLAIGKSYLDTKDELFQKSILKIDNDEFYDVTFNEKRPLGVVFERSGEWAIIKTSTNQAESGLRVGSVLSSVNRYSVILESYQDTIDRLKGWTPPLVLGFRRAPRKAGYLLKESKSRSNPQKMVWKKRYFIMQEGRIFYKDSEDADARIKGECPLMGSVVSLIKESETGKRNCFRLMSGMMYLTLQSSNEALMMEWAATMYHAISIANGGAYILQYEMDRMKAHAEDPRGREYDLKGVRVPSVRIQSSSKSPPTSLRRIVQAMSAKKALTPFENRELIENQSKMQEALKAATPDNFGVLVKMICHNKVHGIDVTEGEERLLYLKGLKYKRSLDPNFKMDDHGEDLVQLELRSLQERNEKRRITDASAQLVKVVLGVGYDDESIAALERAIAQATAAGVSKENIEKAKQLLNSLYEGRQLLNETLITLQNAIRTRSLSQLREAVNTASEIGFQNAQLNADLIAARKIISSISKEGHEKSLAECIENATVDNHDDLANAVESSRDSSMSSVAWVRAQAVLVDLRKKKAARSEVINLLRRGINERDAILLQTALQAASLQGLQSLEVDTGLNMLWEIQREKADRELQKACDEATPDDHRHLEELVALETSGTAMCVKGGSVKVESQGHTIGGRVGADHAMVLMAHDRLTLLKSAHKDQSYILQNLATAIKNNKIDDIDRVIRGADEIGFKHQNIEDARKLHENLKKEQIGARRKDAENISKQEKHDAEISRAIAAIKLEMARDDPLVASLKRALDAAAALGINDATVVAGNKMLLTLNTMQAEEALSRAVESCRYNRDPRSLELAITRAIHDGVSADLIANAKRTLAELDSSHMTRNKALAALDQAVRSRDINSIKRALQTLSELAGGGVAPGPEADRARKVMLEIYREESTIALKQCLSSPAVMTAEGFDEEKFLRLWKAVEEADRYLPQENELLIKGKARLEEQELLRWKCSSAAANLLRAMDALDIAALESALEESNLLSADSLLAGCTLLSNLKQRNGAAILAAAVNSGDKRSSTLAAAIEQARKDGVKSHKIAEAEAKLQKLRRDEAVRDEIDAALNPAIGARNLESLELHLQRATANSVTSKTIETARSLVGQLRSQGDNKKIMLLLSDALRLRSVSVLEHVIKSAEDAGMDCELLNRAREYRLKLLRRDSECDLLEAAGRTGPIDDLSSVEKMAHQYLQRNGQEDDYSDDEDDVIVDDYSTTTAPTRSRSVLFKKEHINVEDNMKGLFNSFCSKIDSTGANCPEFINAMKFSSIWRLITGEKGNLFKEMQMYKRFDVSNRGALSEMDFLDGWALIFSEPGGDVYLKNFQVMAAAGFKKA